MKKAREDAIFKKKMTERSNFSATEGVKKAKTKVLQKDDSQHDFLVTPAESKKHGKQSGFGGIDSAQIVPPKNRDYDFTQPRPPLHLPKSHVQPPPEEKKPKVKSPVVPRNRSKSPPVDSDNDDDSKNLVDKQLNEISDRIDERDPKLYVDVNIGKNGMERITVYEGDTAESLADQFCKKHKLNPDMKSKLMILLDQQIAGVLPKIAEDEYDEELDEEKRERDGTDLNTPLED